MSHRQEQKAAARAAREQAERQAAAEAGRRRTLALAGAIAVAAIVVVLVVVLTSGGGGSSGTEVKAGEAAPGGPETVELLGGIPQKGLALGEPSAKLTLVEFADLQCPVCKEYDAKVFATLIDKYVRTGEMRMELRIQSFLGPDSVLAGKALAAAAAQDKGWDFAHLFYVNQGTENSGYVTDDFLRSIGSAVKGLDVDKMMDDRNKSAAQDALTKGERDFQAAGMTGTPSFLIGPTGGKLETLEFTKLEPGEFTKKIDPLLK